MSTAFDKNKLDTVQIFEAYVTFHGNVTKTAIACNVDDDVVEALAKSENWPAKVKRWTELIEGNPREVQVQINRAINYVQAARLRSLLDQVIRHLDEGSAEDLIKKLTIEGAHGPQFKTRALTDLVKAAESVQLMTERALGDVRAEQPEGKETHKASSIALSVLAALNAAETDLNLDSVEVVKKQLALP
jgi:hypothetical protein